MPEAAYLGFDPGGQDDGTGVALLIAEDKRLRCVTSCVDSVDAALKWAKCGLANGTPVAAGLDTFLFWEPSRAGWRPADRWLKKHYSQVSDSVFSSNSAYGSMAVQGMALAILARQHWPNIELTETHPKVLYYALSKRTYEWPTNMVQWLLKQMGCVTAEIANDHCWDAAISAWAALQGHARRWKHDLRELSEAPIEPAGRCAYWWPE
jgi:hypothetical protein